MEIKKGHTYSNFSLEDISDIKEISSKVYIFKHEKSGARLLFIKNDDKNKVFCVTFRTPPVDDCGTAHILEHSVLCGSKKYPLKEPFVELIKSSLNTFLNAMTFSDKTMYPVASQNDADFKNLMDVYLDAVFNPLIYDNDHILEQEGWHYHIENKEDDIFYNGVVYNEMKGAFSNPEDILYRNIESSLYPNTPYGFESGGDPEAIPQLTRDKFLDFHKMYYHPANSYITIYGDTDILEHLEYIDKEYLNNYTKITPDSKINKEKNFKPYVQVEKEYSVSSDENIDNKYLMAYNFSIGNSSDLETVMKFNILTRVLFDSDSSPLKKALIDEGIADEVSLDFNSGILQPVLSVVAKNAKKDKIEKFKEVIISTLKNLSENGIDKILIDSAINNFEFELKENDSGSYPKGLLYSIMVMESWLYDEDPTIHLRYEDILEKIKKEVCTGVFEKAIKKHILDNEHNSYIVLKPKVALSAKKDEQLAKELKEYKNSLTEKEVDELVKNTNELIEIQSTPDSEEVKDLIPIISVDEIDKEPDIYEDVQTKKNKNSNIYLRSDETKGITYLDINYEVGFKNEYEISAAQLLAKALTNFSTKNYSVLELNNEINLNIGDVGFLISSYQDTDDINNFRAFFTAYAKAFNVKEEDMYRLIREITEKSIFENKDKLKDIVKEEISKMQSKVIGASHRIALGKLSSSYSRQSKFLEYTSGIDYLKFLENINENFENESDKVFSTFKALTDRIINSRKDIIITTTKDNIDHSFELAQNYLKDLDDTKSSEIIFPYEDEELMLGVKIPSLVNYVGKGYNFRKLGYKYHGSLLVLKKYLSTEYLWNKVRVMGGAYGSFINIDKFGNFSLVSYRDPNIQRTLDVYDNIPNEVENLKINQKNLSKLIIGTIGDIDSPVPIYSRAREYVIRRYQNDTPEGIRRRRAEILGATSHQMNEAYEMINESLLKSNICVLGTNEKIEQSSAIFKEIITLF